MKTKEQLLDELKAAQERVAELERLERERGSAEEEVRKRAAQAALLYEVGQRVSGKLRLEALFSEIVTAIRDAFEYDGVLLMLVDAETEHVVLKTVVGGYADILPIGLSVAIGEGMTGQAAATGKAQISGDVTKNPHYVQKAEETTRSELAVPITSGQTVIGVLDLQSDQYDAFDEADVMLMETLAVQLAVAIENARLYETVQEELIERRRAEDEAQRRAAHAALLYEVGQRVSSTLDLEALFSMIVVAVRDAFDYDGVHLMLIDDQASRLTLQTMAGSYADFTPEDLWVTVGEGMTGRAAATGETQLSGDVSQSPYYVPKAEEKTKAELAVPIKSRDKVIGVLDLQSDEYDAFDETDVILMETLADQLAVAIENARLYYKVQQELDGRKRIEKALRESREALQQSYAEVEKRVEERTAELERESAERERLQRELIEAQRQALRELSTPIIPILDRIIVMPLVGSIDSMRARDITRSLLAGIQKHRAKVVILDITGVPIVDSGVADHLNRTIQAGRLKGARTMITGISDAVAETIVDLGIDWQSIATLGDLQSGLIVALRSLGIELRKREADRGIW
jgi:GAF domain-containing protein